MSKNIEQMEMTLPLLLEGRKKGISICSTVKLSAVSKLGCGTPGSIPSTAQGWMMVKME